MKELSEKRRRLAYSRIAFVVDTELLKRQAPRWEKDMQICWNASEDSVKGAADAAISASAAEECRRILG